MIWFFSADTAILAQGMMILQIIGAHIFQVRVE